ncbi:hypothetical protein [Bradyrhizobium sp. WSM471]|uniref:hypothetical protein n=1 Tax=Bradyrhizobium sp. WSM471 TaxID=319017 RepID=UPI001E2F1746|nr:MULTISPECIES: hypothetical protein [Bradyrhizobium]UFW43206.1 hypothetical protein BcanWSM471_09050 [Bradyrhizobium canariense]
MAQLYRLEEARPVAGQVQDADPEGNILEDIDLREIVVQRATQALLHFAFDQSEILRNLGQRELLLR